MKKNLLLVALCGALIACNGGGGSDSSNGGGGGNNEWFCSFSQNIKSCYTLKDLPYSYTVNHATGEVIDGYPVGDMRPFGSSLKITYTFTNPYESMPIWFVKSTTGQVSWFGLELESGSPHYSSSWYKFYNDSVVNGTCKNYTIEKPLQPNQSCTFILDLTGQNNFTESELFNFYNTTYAGSGFGLSYFFKKDPHGGDDWSGWQLLNTYVRAGSWYTKQQGYDLGLSAGQSLGSFNVLNIGGSTANGGHDYIFPTLRAGNAQPFVAQFTESGLAYINTSAPVACPIPGCLNDTYITPLMYSILWYASGPELVTYVEEPARSENELVQGLNKRSYTRGGRVVGGNGIPNVANIYAVQKDGTIIGKNTNGEYGCFNNDGSGFRAFPALPDGYSWWWTLDRIPSNAAVYNTMSYGDTNWITLTDSKHAEQRIKVIADNSGTCRFDFNNLIIDQVEIYTAIWGVVPQAAQITPNGIYSIIRKDGIQEQLRFYKYPPRE